MSEANPLYWRRKLSAYLHDSPDKVLSILDHEERARRIAGEIPAAEQSRKEADWSASAADRLPFPPSSQTKTELSCFLHPLGGDDAKVWLNEQDLPVGLAEDTSQTTRPRLNEENPRAAFIATWRFWRNWAASRHPDFALYPAETRLPDHTIWNHLAVTSAMQGCLGGEHWKQQGDAGVADTPAFLLFTIGPVQDFISAARSTRDLWSGSYLLSYLIGHVLRRIALDFGPDHVIFPNLCDQPIMDLLLRDEIWDHVSTVEGKPLFEAFNYYEEDARQRLLNPSLPNRFLAVLPEKMAEHHDRGPQFASVTLFKRSGETIEWGCKWESGGLELYRAIADGLADKELSAKFPYRFAELLELYRTTGNGLARQDDAESFEVASVIHKEFEHAVLRQSAPGQANTVREKLQPKLTVFLEKLAGNWDKLTAGDKRPAKTKCQTLLESLIGLCQTVAFIERNLPKGN